MQYKFINHFIQCDYHPIKSSLSSSFSNNQSVNPTKIAPPPPNTEVAPPSPPTTETAPPPPNTEVAPPPPPTTEVAPPPPPTIKAAPPPPTNTEAAPPPPLPPTTEAAPPPPTSQVAQAIIKDDIIFKSGNIVINRADNHIDAFAFLLSEKRMITEKEFQPYLYIFPLYMVYRGYNHNYDIFIEHINPGSVKESNLIVQIIIFYNHWTLIIGRLKEKV
ncbi:hypothetical protein IEQ34_007723 [Dendrobium chrysotoxum]|uniref:Uncharacterized protein n=1 Tax=Dendrobium chrysotoxum TaxID=161865 RepID=A0AAV7H210_DENCH|nr:hypothetical protein IEQ34_007723 [Dendrobium chrysotoxum]